MKLVLSRCHPITDAQPLTGYFAREALFRTDDGSFLLYMASEGKTGREERILFLGCRDALVWLNATSDVLGTSSQFAGGGIPSHLSRNAALLISKEIRR
jgi:hypothetical protein